MTKKNKVIGIFGIGIFCKANCPKLKITFGILAALFLIGVLLYVTGLWNTLDDWLGVSSEGFWLNAVMKCSVDKGGSNINNTIKYNLDIDNNQITSGQNLLSIKFTADYALSKNLNALFFYDHSFSQFAVSTAFPQTTINTGFTLRYNFGN